jgi:hypothetical protein
MIFRFFIFLTWLSGMIQAADNGTRLLREPAITRDRIAFVYAGDIWTAPREGGAPKRLTRTPDGERLPRFSPDGKHIAFTRNGDVYVIPVGGGEERRLTWHPQADRAVGWTPDGARVLIHSDRLKHELTRTPHLFLVPAGGGLPEPLPIPRATLGSFSSDGRRIAYGPNPELVLWLPWRNYRGGSLGYIAIYNLANNEYEELPRTKANDVCPMWLKEAVYFLSDRNETMNLYRYDLASKRTERLTSYAEWDIKNPSAGADAIIYENGGWLFTLDPDTHRIRRVSVSVPPEALPRADERAQFRQALDDTWRTYRDNAFALAAAWSSVKPRYEELMNWAAHPNDAESVLRDLLGEASQGHLILNWTRQPQPAAVGLLGADFRAENGFYRIARIYGRAPEEGRAPGPLAAPGLDVKPGDILLAVNGAPIHAGVEVYAAFEGAAGKDVKLRVSDSPAGAAREIVVRPIADESALRYFDWVRSNRARVTEATGGHVGYIHVGNVGQSGVELFRKEWRDLRTRVAAMIVDARNNSGGGGADDVVDWIARKPTRLMYDRRGRVPPWDYFLDGPKVLMVNDQSVSGGDELPYLFKLKKAGPVVGTRTFGAMIGSGATHKIAGGWELLVPTHGFYWLESASWAPENYGVEPDHVVELKPEALTGGRDPQLEKAIDLAITALKIYKKLPDPPPYRPTR